MQLMTVPQQNIQHRVLDNISTTVMLFNAALKLEYINPAGEMLLAASARHLIGMHAFDLLKTDNSLVGQKKFEIRICLPELKKRFQSARSD